MSPLISLTYLLCQSESPEELERTARELGCIECGWRYEAFFCRLPSGESGSFRASRDPARGIRGHGFVWCPDGAAE